MDDSTVVWRLRKVHIWVPLQCLVTFTRVSSGREEARGEWRGGIRGLLCRAMPWVVRSIVFLATWPTLCVIPTGILRFEYDLQQRYGQSFLEPSHEECTSFTGFAVPCDELRRVREFNGNVMPTMQNAGYRVVRKAMNDHGFPGHVWHVGHACPDPSKKSKRDDEDLGWNLFAQHAVDNANLGHCLVSCAEAAYVGASHVRCAASDRCVQTCSDIQ